MGTVDALHGLTLGDLLAEHARGRPHEHRDRRRRRPAHVRRARRPGEPARARARAPRASRPATGCSGSGRTRSACVELLLAAARLGAMFCPANWRQSARGARVRDRRPLAAGGRLAGGGGRRHGARRSRRSRRTDARWIRHDDDGPDGYEALLATGVRVTARHRGRPGRRRCSSSTRPRSPAGPTAPCSATPRCIAQGLVYGALHGHVGRRRVPEQRAAVPPRHAHAHVRDVRRSAAPTCSLRRVDGDELCRHHRRGAVHGRVPRRARSSTQILEANADGRYDLSSPAHRVAADPSGTR